MNPPNPAISAAQRRTAIVLLEARLKRKAISEDQYRTLRQQLEAKAAKEQ